MKIILSLVFVISWLYAWEQNNVVQPIIPKYKIENSKSINITGEFCSPIWSPKGESILVTEIGYRGLYVIDITKHKVRMLNNSPGVGYNAVWSIEGEKIFYRFKNPNSEIPFNLEVHSVDLITGETMYHPEINPDGLKSFVMATDNYSPIVYTNVKTLQIEAQTLDKSKTWYITKGPGQFYKAILSPDKKKIVLHKGSEMLVYAADGSGIICSLGNGIACSWSADSKQILYFLDESTDGHQITGSEIFLVNADGTNRWQLTNTLNVSEMFPCWSPDNKHIAYSDDRTGKIFIADFVNYK